MGLGSFLSSVVADVIETASVPWMSLISFLISLDED